MLTNVTYWSKYLPGISSFILQNKTDAITSLVSQVRTLRYRTVR